MEHHRSHARTGVDVAALRAVADQFGIAADLIDRAARHHLLGLGFNGATAGRAHAGRGDALRAALRRLEGELSQWSRAALGIAVSLRAAADRYTEADLGAAARID